MLVWDFNFIVSLFLQHDSNAYTYTFMCLYKSLFSYTFKLLQDVLCIQ